MRAQHCTNVVTYLPAVCKDKRQLTPASSLSSVSSHGVNMARCVCCRIKVTHLDHAKPESLPQPVLQISPYC